MSLIEGIGDEVTKFFLVLLIICIAALAWWSTGLAQRPLIRTVLIFEHRTRTQSPPIISMAQNSSMNSREENNEMSRSSNSQNVRINNSTINHSCDNSNTNSSENSVNTAHEEQENSNVQTEMTSEEEEQNNIVEIMDSEPNIIRRRRLAFFQNQSDAHMSNTNSEENVCKTKTNANINKSPEMPSKNADEVQSSSKQNVNNIRIKLKYLNDDLKLVQGSLQEQLGEFKRRHFEVELAACKLVRLIFNGQVLREDNETLEKYGLFDNCVVHCLVYQAPVSSTASSNDVLNTNSNIQSENIPSLHRHLRMQRDNDNLHWNLGNLLFVLTTFILTTVWYFRYEYAHLFTVTATVGLVCLTGIFTLLTICLFFPVTPTHSNSGNTQADHGVETVAATII